MLSEEALERLSERLVNRIEELNLYMIEKLGEQIVDIGTLTPSQLREVFQSIKYGNSLDDIAYQLADITNKNVKDIYEIFEEVAKQSQEYARQFYEYKNTDFIPFDENKILQQQVRTIAKATADEYLNMSKTFAYTFYSESGIKEFSSLSETYQKVTDRAILSLSQGRESFDTVMKRTMRELASQGLRTVDYASGYSRRADSSVRMNLMDGTRRLNRELQMQFGKEFGSDGVEISHHKNAAPDHIDTIDGKQFSTKGEVTIDGITYKDYDTVNNSLDRHVGELNCYHYIYSIVLGVSKPLYSKEELETDKRANEEGFEFEGKHYTMYEGTQLQRQIETKIRQYKDRQIGAKTINDIDEVYHCEEKIRQLTQKYKELSDVSGLPTKVDRLRVEGYTKISVKKSTEYFDLTNASNTNIKNNVQNAINMLPDNIRQVCKNTKFKTGEINKYVPKDDIIYINEKSDKYTVIHEIGHVLDKKLDIFNDKDFVDAISSKFKNYKFLDFEKTKYRNGVILYHLKDSTEFVSKYQTTIYQQINGKKAFTFLNKVNHSNAKEYFSEGLKYYFMNPKLLKEKDTKLFEYIVKIMEGLDEK